MPVPSPAIAPGPHDIAVVKFFPKIWVVKRAASQPAIDRKPEFPIGILTDDVGNVLFQNNKAVGTRGQGGDPPPIPQILQITEPYSYKGTVKPSSLLFTPWIFKTSYGPEEGANQSALQVSNHQRTFWNSKKCPLKVTHMPSMWSLDFL